MTFFFCSLLCLFLLATCFQLLIWLGVFARFAHASIILPESPPPSTLPISIVVCARNEAENLQRSLPLWLAQTYTAHWELLIVDDASDDQTPAILASFQAANSRLRVLRLPEKTTLGKKAALAQGIAATYYDHLLLTDADCAPVSEQWLAHLAGVFAADIHTEIILGYAPLSAQPGLVNGWARFETAYTALQYFAFAHAGMPYMGVGRNLAWKRPLFRRAGGFVPHADLPSGDDDLLVNAVARRGQVALCLHPAAFVYSEAKPTWRAWLRQKQRQLGSGLRYRWWHQVILGALAGTHTLHYGLGAILLLADYYSSIVLLAWLLRLLLVLRVWQTVVQRFREPYLWWAIPFYDGLLAVYYGVFVPFTFLPLRRVKHWK